MTKLSQGLPANLTPSSLSAAFANNGQDSTQRLMRKLRSEVADAALMVVGDSTSNDTNEWVYLLAQALGVDWPRWTISYRLANDTNSNYDAAVTIQTGTGARTLTIWNASIPGYHTLYFQGLRAGWAIFPYDPDLILLSLGHNEGTGRTEADWHSRYVSLTESITERLTGDVILIAQNPETLNGDQALRAEVYRKIAVSRGFGFIDVHQAFVDTGAIASYLNVDGIHPNAAGSVLWRDTVKPAFVLQPKSATPRAQPPSTLVGAGEQLLANGDFVTLPDHVQPVQLPGAWWADAATTIAKDTTNYESARGWAVQLTSASATTARLGQNIDVKRARGRWLTVAYRVFIPTGQPQTTAWVYLSDGGIHDVSVPGTYSPGAFQWIVATLYVDPAATVVNTYIQCDGANLSGKTVTVDRVVLAFGKLPRGSTDNADRATIAGLALKGDKFTGTGSPEGVVTALPGSLFTRTDLADQINECIYPISDTSAATTGWVGSGGTLTNPTGYLRNTATSGTFDIHSATTTTFPVAPGAAYTFYGQVRDSSGLAVQFFLQFYTAGGVATGTARVGSTLTMTTVFADIPAYTTVAPADAAFVNIRFYTSDPAAGQTMDVRHVMYTQIPGTYFDGTFAPAGGRTFSWTGAANGSTSKAVSLAPVTYVKAGTGGTGWKSLPQATAATVPAAAVDAATTQALVNAMRAALVNAGMLA